MALAPQRGLRRARHEGARRRCPFWYVALCAVGRISCGAYAEEVVYWGTLDSPDFEAPVPFQMKLPGSGASAGRPHWQVMQQDLQINIQRDGDSWRASDSDGTTLIGAVDPSGSIAGKLFIDAASATDASAQPDGTFFLKPAPCQLGEPVITLEREHLVRYQGKVTNRAWRQPMDIKVQIGEARGRWQVADDDTVVEVTRKGEILTLQDSDGTTLNGRFSSSGEIRGKISLDDSDGGTSDVTLTPEKASRLPGTSSVKLMCGEDAAMAAARAATHRRTGFTSASEAFDLAIALNASLALEAPNYAPLPEVDIGTKRQRPRLLEKAQTQSRRAYDHIAAEEHTEAVADLIRALLFRDPTFDDAMVRALLRQSLEGAVQRQKLTQGDGGVLEDLFDALGIDDTGAENDELDLKSLKRVYRDMSIKYHPDKNPNAKGIFNAIRDAYEILSDPVKTMLYDTGGQELLTNYDKDLVEKTEDMEMNMNVDLKDVYVGTVHYWPHKRRVVCRSCRMQPDLPRCKACRACPKTREIHTRQIHNRLYREEVMVESKEKCFEKTDKIAMAVEKGMMNGDRIHFPNMAKQLPKKVPGDFLAKIQVRKHYLFQRVGNDLQVTFNISLFEALLGFERRINHLDGHVLKFGVDRGEVLGARDVLEIEGEGMPVREDPTSFGKLQVRFEIQYPTKVPVEVQPELESALRALDKANRGGLTSASAGSQKQSKHEL